MGLRETLNKNQKAVMIGTGVVVVLAIGAAIFLSGGGTHPSSVNPKAFYTIDDGKTHFADDDMPFKIAPFDKDGKKAYRCQVYSCDGGKTTTVVYVQRWADAAKQVIEKARAAGKMDDPAVIAISDGAGSEIKLANVPDIPANWVKWSDPRITKMVEPRCPPGSDAQRLVPD